MEKVTYTKGQLEAFTLKELKTLELYSKIDPKITKKADVVKAMMKAQKEEVEAIKAASQKEEVKTESEISKSEDSVSEENETNNEKESEDNSDAKPVFHRKSNRKVNPMTFN